MSEQRGKIHSSLTVLVVSDLLRSQAFYRDVLGCEITEYWAIRDGLHGLGFKLLQAQHPDEVRPNSGNGRIVWDSYAYAHDLAALDELYEELKEKGARIVQEPVTETFDWGSWKEFSIQDPDGYVIGFGSNF